MGEAEGGDIELEARDDARRGGDVTLAWHSDVA